jgi:Skp family chaperone for outer membrane proteins
MLKKIQERIFPFLIALSALSVSASAAFYSVSGLSKLFAGAAFAVIVMAASLEVAKLVIASLLYQYRKNLPRLLKWYLSMACVVLILITSMGIYGFLSAAYQETAAKAGNIDAQIALIETKRDNVKEQLVVYNEEKSSINEAVADLRKGLSNNVIQYKDKETGEIITTTSSRTRNALEKQLDQAIERQTQINAKVDELNTKIFDYETEIVEVRTSDAVSSELGPLKYLSGLTGTPMDKIINWLLLTIIFVFDPLAIALVVAANFAFEQLRPKTKENLYGETVVIDDTEEDDGMWEDEEMEDFKQQYPEPAIPDEDEWEEAEERMNVIGQNGNEGEHYYEQGYIEEEKELEDRIKRTPKVNKYGPTGWKTLTNKLNELKNNRYNNDDDLTIRY